MMYVRVTFANCASVLAIFDLSIMRNVQKLAMKRGTPIKSPVKKMNQKELAAKNNMSVEQLEEIREAFDLFDTDGSGRLTWSRHITTTVVVRVFRITSVRQAASTLAS